MSRSRANRVGESGAPDPGPGNDGRTLSRRRLLGTGGGVVSLLLGGCLDGMPLTGDGGDQELELQSLDVAGSPGGPITLAPPGTVALLDFFATWCPPCKPEMANLRAARARFDREAVQLVSITQESEEAPVRQFWTDYDGTWPVVLDPDLRASRTYDVIRLPTIVVLGADGGRVFRHTGLAGEARIVDAIEHALDAEG